MQLGDRSLTCTGKRRYTRRRQAFTALCRTTDAVNLHIYRCPYCNRWHVGHKSLSLLGKNRVMPEGF